MTSESVQANEGASIIPTEVGSGSGAPEGSGARKSVLVIEDEPGQIGRAHV